MFDQLKVLFVLTGASTYLVSKNGLRTSSDSNDTTPVRFSKIFANGTSLPYDFDDSTPFDYDGSEDSHQNHSQQSAETSGSSGADGSELISDFIRSKDLDANLPDRPSYHVELVEENDREVPQKILRVTAPDGVVGPVVYSMEGPEINSYNGRREEQKFSINATTGEVFVLRALDRDFPYGQADYSFTVFAEDAHTREKLGSANVYVTLKDLNDNTPFFPQHVFQGSVKENSPLGTPILLNMRAQDYDDPHEGTNARVTYSIEQNQVNDNGELIFRIDEHTGTISTAVCCLDRERSAGYVIKVVAMDGDPSHKTTATASIQILDENDMTPQFIKKEWVLDIDETDGDADLPSLSILDVSVTDGDLPETNVFRYKVVENAFGADKFEIVTNPDCSGSLKIIKELDYEVASQRNGFNLTILVADDGNVRGTDPRRLDYAKVRIRIRDINDNSPKFQNQHIQVTVPEDTKVGSVLATFRATDLDASGQSRVVYAIEKSSDRRRHFRVSQNSGIVTLQRPLDRERSPRHHVRVTAADDGVPPRTSTATLTLILSDVNDCEPRLKRDYNPVVPEHQGAMRVQDIEAVDDDEMINGPPFLFWIDPQAPESIKRAFRLEVNPNGNGTAVVYSRHTFDREQQKIYTVPILIKDSGTPALTGTSTLTVTIGDKNDHRMFPGSKRILVYSLHGAKGMFTVGKVHVEDADDWDFNDKSYFWENNVAHPNFNLDQSTGEIVLRNATPGSYFLKFLVYDRHHTMEVGANVTVVVREVTEEDVRHGASLRFSGVLDEELVRVWLWQQQQVQVQKLEVLRELLADLVKADVNNVHIFSVIQRQLKPVPITEVWYFVRSSEDEYLRPEMLNGLVEMNRQLLARKLSLAILEVGVNECLPEVAVDTEDVCDQESCTNQLVLSGSHIVVNANRTAFVGVNVTSVARCECGARNGRDSLRNCSRHSCNGRGRCAQDDNAFHCECPPGFNGPNCEQTTRSFRGDGFAWFSPIESCEQLHISFDFKTSNENGLLLYAGPLRADSGDNLRELLAVELVEGKLRLVFNVGSGTAEVRVDGEDSLANELWHRVDVFMNGQDGQLMVDLCGDVPRKFNRVGSSFPPPARPTPLRTCLNQTTLPSAMDNVAATPWRQPPPQQERRQPQHKANGKQSSSPAASSLLNVKHPVQLGGAFVTVREKNAGAAASANSNYHHQHTSRHSADLNEFYNDLGWKHRPDLSKPFTGCIRHLVINSQLVDLENPAHSLNSRSGCPSDEPSCAQLRCVHGICDADDSATSGGNGVGGNDVGGNNNAASEGPNVACVCQPGWSGTRCAQETPSRMLQHGSFIKFALSFEPDPFRTDVQMQFRSRQQEGELISFASKQTREYAVLEIVERKLRFRFNLERLATREKILHLGAVPIDDGRWHTVRVRRFGCFAFMQLDQGQGASHVELVDDLSCSNRLLYVDRQRVVVGGTVRYTHGNVVTVDNDLNSTCVRDIRVEGRLLSLEDSDQTPGTSDVGSPKLASSPTPASGGFVLEARNVVRGCPSNNPCHGVVCKSPFMCIDLWNEHACRCPPGFRQSGPFNCTDLDECETSFPCLNGGMCLNRPNGRGFSCTCTSRFRGETCAEPMPVEQMYSFNMAAVSAVIVCALNLLVLLLIIVAYLRSRRPKTSDQQTKSKDDKKSGEHPEIRETIIAYHDEGGGEDDVRSFDISQLRIPMEEEQRNQHQMDVLQTSVRSPICNEGASSAYTTSSSQASQGPVLLSHALVLEQPQIIVEPQSVLGSYPYETHAMSMHPGSMLRSNSSGRNQHPLKTFNAEHHPTWNGH